ncbi:MAG: DUF4153 domain-containing protein [Bacillota bacterium]
MKLALLSLILAVFFDYLFYSKPFGISYPIYVLSFLALFYWSCSNRIAIRNPFGWFILIPAILLSSAFFIHSNPVLHFINIFMVPVLITWYTLLVSGCSLSLAYPDMIKIIALKMVSAPLANTFEPYKIILQSLKKNKTDSSNQTKKKIMLGLVISVPMLSIVVFLLSSADMVFSYYLSNIFIVIPDINFPSLVSQIMLIAAVFSYTFGFLWSFNNERPIKPSGPPCKNLHPVTLITVLVMLNIVYALFSLIQFSYLYGGQENSLPANFSYAEYARKGFFELVTVTIINFSIFLAAIRHTGYVSKPTENLLKVFLSLLIMFTLNMLFSAHFKMSLYEEAYGLTYLRVFVHAFILLLFLLLIVGLIKTWYNKIPMAKIYIVATITVYTALNYVNVDKLIAKSNIQLFHKTGHIDINYLANLSYDAVPLLTVFLKQYPSTSEESSEQVYNSLNYRKKELKQHSQYWQSFNYSKLKARKSLDSMERNSEFRIQTSGLLKSSHQGE